MAGDYRRLIRNMRKDVDFVDLGYRMRKAQNKYFRERTPENLEASKAIEREFDREIAERRKPPTFFD